MGLERRVLAGSARSSSLSDLSLRDAAQLAAQRAEPMPLESRRRLAAASASIAKISAAMSDSPTPAPERPPTASSSISCSGPRRTRIPGTLKMRGKRPRGVLSCHAQCSTSELPGCRMEYAVTTSASKWTLRKRNDSSPGPSRRGTLGPVTRMAMPRLPSSRPRCSSSLRRATSRSSSDRTYQSSRSSYACSELWRLATKAASNAAISWNRPSARGQGFIERDTWARGPRFPRRERK